MALQLFMSFHAGVQVDDIVEDEAEWIERASLAAIITAEPYEGECYKYDHVSIYPSILSTDCFFIPTKRGEFKTLSDSHFQNEKYCIRCV